MNRNLKGAGARMKRLLYLILALLLLLAVTAAVSAEEAGPLAGDVTGDGVVDGRDIVRLLKKLNGEDVEVNLSSSDVTNDAIVGMVDIETMVDYIAEKPETKLAEPVEREIKVEYIKQPSKPERRTITVEIYDRGREGIDPADNVWTDYIKQGMLEKYNIEVIFVPVGRWTETDDIANLLAASDAPDICYTYGSAIIPTFASLKDAEGNPGIIDMAPLLEANRDQLPNLIAQLGGEENLYYDQDPETGAVYMIEGARADTARTATFIRKDWLDKLGLAVPTTEKEFHDALVAFRDNAELLLGADAKKMIPYSTSTDIGWRNDLLGVSKVPDNVDDETLYVYGTDDRHVLYPGYKEGVRVLGEWYDEGLVWKDFSLYNDSEVEDDNMKAGYVGAFQHNWDYPFRNGDDSINMNLRRNVGEDAEFIAVDCFRNDAGVTRKYLSSAIGMDRKIFLPATNDEPEASLLYLDFISSPEVIKYLQIGQEGENHTVTADGAYQIISAQGEWAMSSPNNIDYTITNNGLNIGEATEATLALSYQEPAENVINAHKIASSNGRVVKHYNVGSIDAETESGAALAEKRDELLTKAVTASPENFDNVYDAGMDEYLGIGGSDAIDERIDRLYRLYNIEYVI